MKAQALASRAPELQQRFSASPLPAQALSALRCLSAEVRAARTEVLGHLSEAGIAATPQRGPEDEDALQFHQCGIRLSGADLDRAVAVVEALGFIAPMPMTAARLAVLRRVATSLSLVRFDASSLRLVLHFGDRPTTALPRVLRPGLPDLAYCALPRWLAPVYTLVRPMRIAQERLSGKRRPMASSDLLGTPHTLIGPLLDWLKLGPQDVLIDLGCGDGRIVAQAVKNHGCHAIGVEAHPDIARKARDRIAALGPAAMRARIEEGPGETADLSTATVIFMFLPTHLRARLLAQVRAKVGPEVRIVLHEQARVVAEVPPVSSAPIFSENAMTVVQVWQGAAPRSHPPVYEGSAARP